MAVKTGTAGDGGAAVCTGSECDADMHWHTGNRNKFVSVLSESEAAVLQCDFFTSDKFSICARTYVSAQ